MHSLSKINAEVDRRAALIGAAGHHALPTYGRSEDLARPHIEVDSRGYHFVVVERGQELERLTTDNLDELLFRIFQSITHDLAFAYELAHRIETQDCRRLGFRRQIELLSVLSPSWAEREALEHDRILKEHPFNDMVGSELRDAGHSPHTASQIASQHDPLPVAQHNFGSHERGLQANDLRHRRNSIIILSIVYGLQSLLLLPWPIASFMAIFFFDAPIRSSGDEISRYLAAFSIWFYPVLYGIALLISLLAFRKKKPLSVITLPALLPLISPLYLFAFFGLWGKKG